MLNGSISCIVTFCACVSISCLDTIVVHASILSLVTNRLLWFDLPVCYNPLNWLNPSLCYIILTRVSIQLLLQLPELFQSIYMLQSAAEFQSRHLLHFSIVVSFTDYVTKSPLKIQSVLTVLLSSGGSIKCYGTIRQRVSINHFVTGQLACFNRHVWYSRITCFVRNFCYRLLSWLVLS